MSKIRQFMIVMCPTMIAGILGHLYFNTHLYIGLSFLGGALIGLGFVKLRKAKLKAIRSTQTTAAEIEEAIKQGEKNDLDSKN